MEDQLGDLDKLMHKLQDMQNALSSAILELKIVETWLPTSKSPLKSAGTASDSSSSLKQASYRIHQILRGVHKDLTDSLDHELFRCGEPDEEHTISPHDPPEKPYTLQRPLKIEEYQLYGRQLIMPQVGLQGQTRLKKASVLVVGIGGLGCPAATYLASAGVGRLGFVDGDVVELSNLHRQILHSRADLGKFKVDSAISSLRQTNPDVQYEAHRSHITPEKAVSLLEDYDLVLDCTDHPTSRYLISDTAVVLSKPLVSASALRTEGQLMVLNYPAAPPGADRGGPCYRCVFPKPPPADSVISCGEGGILGPVVGVMGVLQALEAIKIIIQNKSEYDYEPSMLLFSAFSKQSFRRVRLRGRKPGCKACSQQATISRDSITSGETDYVKFCGIMAPVNALTPSQRVSSETFAKELQESKYGKSSLLVDVRDNTQFELCNLSESINIPYTDILEWAAVSDVDNRLLQSEKTNQSVRFICRYGNDSQLAVEKLKSLGLWSNNSNLVQDIEGGWRSWKLQVDHDWPDY